MCGLSETTMSRICSGQYAVDEETLYLLISKICKAVIDLYPKIDFRYIKLMVALVKPVPLSPSNEGKLYGEIRAYQEEINKPLQKHEKLTFSFQDFEPHEMAMLLTPIVGRNSEIKAVRAALQIVAQSEFKHVVSIIGGPGVGKTRLMLEVMEYYLPTDMFPGMYTYISLVRVSDPRSVPHNVAKKLRVLGEPTPERIAACLPDKRSLLIIDNLEHVMKAVEDFFFPLLNACIHQHKSLKLFFTSQHPLSGPIEWPIYITPLAYPPKGRSVKTVDDLQEFDATALFCQHARKQITTEDVPYIVHFCQAIDGIPLAIELVANRVSDKLSPQEIYDDFKKHGIATFRLRNRYSDPRHTSLYGAIEWSYRLLSPSEKKLFYRLSLFHSGCTADAAYQVCNIDRDVAADKEIMQDLLDDLVSYSLLKKDREDETVRYSMLQVIALFVQMRLQETQERHPEEFVTLQKQYAEYYLALAEPSEKRLRGQEQKVCFKELTREMENLQAVYTYFEEENNAEGLLRLVGGLGWYWYITRNRNAWKLRDWWTWADKALSIAEPPIKQQDTAYTLLYAKALSVKGFLTNNIWLDIIYSDPDMNENKRNDVRTKYQKEASTLLQQSIKLYEGVGAKENVAFVLITAADMLVPWPSATQEATRLLKISFAMFEGKNTWGEALILLLYSYCAVCEGRLEEAQDALERSLELFTISGDEFGVWWTKDRLLTVNSFIEDYKETA